MSASPNTAVKREMFALYGDIPVVPGCMGRLAGTVMGCWVELDGAGFGEYIGRGKPGGVLGLLIEDDDLVEIEEGEDELEDFLFFLDGVLMLVVGEFG